MIALIDTIFAPFLNWLNEILNMLTNARLESGYTLNLGGVFNTLTFISPAWALLIINVVVLAGSYMLIFIIMNGLGTAGQFKHIVKFW